MILSTSNDKKDAFKTFIYIWINTQSIWIKGKLSVCGQFLWWYKKDHFVEQLQIILLVHFPIKVWGFLNFIVLGNE